MTAFCLDRWNGWLAHALYPHANLLKVDLETDTPENIFARHDEGIFLFHIAHTYPNRLVKNRESLVKLLQQNNIQTVNANVVDNSKKFLHTLLSANGLPDLTITSRNGYENELLIVKSNFNNLAIRDVDAKNLHPSWNLPVPSNPSLIKYVVKTRREMPEYVWDNDDYCVQKFIENTDGFSFRAVFHRGKIVVFTEKSHIRIKKFSSNKRWVSSPDATTSKVFELTEKLAAASGFDFFAVDIVMDNNGARYAIDLNTTPSWSINHDKKVVEALLV